MTSNVDIMARIYVSKVE